jgi:hypothetical protein
MLSNRSFLLRQALLLTLSMVGLLYVFPVGGSLDQAFIQPWVDLHGGFPHRNDWALAVLNHRYIKNIVIGVYVLYIAAWICSFKYPHLKARKFEFGYFIVGCSTQHGSHWVAQITICTCLPLEYDSRYSPWLFLGFFSTPRTLFSRWSCCNWFCPNHWIFCLSNTSTCPCLLLFICRADFRLCFWLGANDAGCAFSES